MMRCGHCGRPLDDHCTLHATRHCPGECPGDDSATAAPGEAAADAADPGVMADPRTDGPSDAVAPSVPDFLREAMMKAGVDPDEVARLAETEDVIPDDADEVLRQAAAATGQGMRCKACGGAVDPHDPNMLVEVIGWAKHRTQGGQNHVIDRAETGLVMCGDCGLRLQHLGSAGFAQESLV